MMNLTISKHTPVRFSIIIMLLATCLPIGITPIAAQGFFSTTALTYSCQDIPQSIMFCGENIDLTRFDRRERIDRELLAFTYMHSTSIQMIKRANRYFPIVESILQENGIPDDFKYLMSIESNNMQFDVCINRKDLLGDPQVGRRFKGTVWLQGKLQF